MSISTSPFYLCHINLIKISSLLFYGFKTSGCCQTIVHYSVFSFLTLFMAAHSVFLLKRSNSVLLMESSKPVNTRPQGHSGGSSTSDIQVSLNIIAISEPIHDSVVSLLAVTNSRLSAVDGK